jgi:hypothetical protein
MTTLKVAAKIEPRFNKRFGLTFLVLIYPKLCDRRRDIQHNDIQHNATQLNDIQHYNTQHNDTQHNDIQHNGIQHNDTQLNDIQHNDIQHFVRFSTIDLIVPLCILTLGISNKCHYAECRDLLIVMLNVILFNVIMLSVNVECFYAECRGALR